MTPNPCPSPDPLESILKEISSVRPTPGMDQRILRAVAQRAAESTARPQRLAWLRTIHLKPVFALTLTFALTAIFLAFFLHPRLTTYPAVPPIQDYAADFHIPPLAIDAATTEKLDPMPKPVLSLTPLPLPVANVHVAERNTPPSELVDHSISKPEIAPSQSRAVLASFPAPPLPLTGQEKLLLRLAHRNDPEALGALTPEKRAAEQAQDTIAFQDFFPPPVPVEYPTLISQANLSSSAPTRTHGAPQ